MNTSWVTTTTQAWNSDVIIGFSREGGFKVGM